MSARLRQLAVVLTFLGAPIGVRIAMAAQRGTVWAGALIVVEAGLIAWIALSAARAGYLRWIGSAAIMAITAAIWRFTPSGIVASSAIPHAIAYLSVLTVFGASLLPGQKPIITIFAEKSRGDLPPPVRLYTRRVTWAWCLFCAGQLLASLLLLLFAPTRVWSAFIGLCNFPLLVAMFCGEFTWRKWRHGAWPRERLTDGFRMAGQLNVTSGQDAG